MIFPFLKHEDSAKYYIPLFAFWFLLFVYTTYTSQFHTVICHFSRYHKFQIPILLQNQMTIFSTIYLCMYMERKMLAFFSLENFPNRSNIVDLTPTHTSPYCNNNLLHCWFIATELVQLLVLFFGF